MLSAVELSGTFRSENSENRILEVWVQPRSPLMDFVLENLRNEGFRSVSDQQKKTEQKIMSGGGEILDGSGRFEGSTFTTQFNHNHNNHEQLSSNGTESDTHLVDVDHCGRNNQLGFILLLTLTYNYCWGSVPVPLDGVLYGCAPPKDVL